MPGVGSGGRELLLTHLRNEAALGEKSHKPTTLALSHLDIQTNLRLIHQMSNYSKMLQSSALR